MGCLNSTSAEPAPAANQASNAGAGGFVSKLKLDIPDSIESSEVKVESLSKPKKSSRSGTPRSPRSRGHGSARSPRSPRSPRGQHGAHKSSASALAGSSSAKKVASPRSRKGKTPRGNKSGGKSGRKDKSALAASSGPKDAWQELEEQLHEAFKSDEAALAALVSGAHSLQGRANEDVVYEHDEANRLDLLLLVAALRELSHTTRTEPFDTSAASSAVQRLIKLSETLEDDSALAFYNRAMERADRFGAVGADLRAARARSAKELRDAIVALGPHVDAFIEKVLAGGERSQMLMAIGQYRAGFHQVWHEMVNFYMAIERLTPRVHYERLKADYRLEVAHLIEVVVAAHRAAAAAGGSAADTQRELHDKYFQLLYFTSAFCRTLQLHALFERDAAKQQALCDGAYVLARGIRTLGAFAQRTLDNRSPSAKDQLMKLATAAKGIQQKAISLAESIDERASAAAAASVGVFQITEEVQTAMRQSLQLCADDLAAAGGRYDDARSLAVGGDGAVGELLRVVGQRVAAVAPYLGANVRDFDGALGALLRLTDSTDYLLAYAMRRLAAVGALDLRAGVRDDSLYRDALGEAAQWLAHSQFTMNVVMGMKSIEYLAVNYLYAVRLVVRAATAASCMIAECLAVQGDFAADRPGMFAKRTLSSVPLHVGVGALQCCGHALSAAHQVAANKAKRKERKLPPALAELDARVPALLTEAEEALDACEPLWRRTKAEAEAEKLAIAEANARRAEEERKWKERQAAQAKKEKKALAKRTDEEIVAEPEQPEPPKPEGFDTGMSYDAAVHGTDYREWAQAKYNYEQWLLQREVRREAQKRVNEKLLQNAVDLLAAELDEMMLEPPMPEPLPENHTVEQFKAYSKAKYLREQWMQKQEAKQRKEKEEERKRAIAQELGMAEPPVPVKPEEGCPVEEFKAYAKAKYVRTEWENKVKKLEEEGKLPT